MYIGITMNNSGSPEFKQQQGASQPPEEILAPVEPNPSEKINQGSDFASPRRQSTRRIAVAPSVLSADFCRLGEEIRAVEAAGADFIHVDVMDGRYVPNITIGPLVVEAMRRATKLPLDVHLMIIEPERYLEDFARAGASSLTIHQEACPHLHRSLQRIQELQVLPGVAINPGTPLDAIEEVFDLVKRILVMTVNPGFGGQAFIPSTEAKILRLSQMLGARDAKGIEIEVDGGMNPETSKRAIAAGATIIVAGSAVFHSPDYRAAIESLRG